MSSNVVTIIGVAMSAFIGATGLGVILPSPGDDVERTVFVEVAEIKSNRYTSKDAEDDWRNQSEVDMKQNLAIMRLQAALDELLEQMEKIE